MQIVPRGLEEFSDSSVFHKERIEKMTPEEIEIKMIGDVKADEDELSILKLNPKFAMMKKLNTIDMEHDTEYCLAKLRYEIRKTMELQREIEIEETEFGVGSLAKRRKIEKELTGEEEEEEIIAKAQQRQIYDSIGKVFNYSKRRVTYLPENNRVMLPMEVEPKLENEIGMLREMILKEFSAYKNEIKERGIKEGVPENKRKNQEHSNLTKQEKRGLKKLRKRLQEKEIVVLKTDKSGKLTLMNREKYLELGKKMNNGDIRIDRKELRVKERKINEHSKMWTKIVNAGEAHNHYTRIKNSQRIESELATSKY